MKKLAIIVSLAIVIFSLPATSVASGNKLGEWANSVRENAQKRQENRRNNTSDFVKHVGKAIERSGGYNNNYNNNNNNYYEGYRDGRDDSDHHHGDHCGHHYLNGTWYNEGACWDEYVQTYDYFGYPSGTALVVVCP